MSSSLRRKSFFERHANKIATAGLDQCWLWTAGALPSGYGKVWAGGRMRLAHRVAYEARHGLNSADGLVVRHKCDNPACVNPAHLELGTQSDNVRDRDERGRQSSGEGNGQTKLSEADVLAIRAVYVRGSSELGRPALARRFGVSHQLIGQVVNRQIWAHVNPVSREDLPQDSSRLAADLQALTLALRIGGLEGLRNGSVKIGGKL